MHVQVHARVVRLQCHCSLSIKPPEGVRFQGPTWMYAKWLVHANWRTWLPVDARWREIRYAVWENRSYWISKFLCQTEFTRIHVKRTCIERQHLNSVQLFVIFGKRLSGSDDSAKIRESTCKRYRHEPTRKFAQPKLPKDLILNIHVRYWLLFNHFTLSNHVERNRMNKILECRDRWDLSATQITHITS